MCPHGECPLWMERTYLEQDQDHQNWDHGRRDLQGT